MAESLQAIEQEIRARRDFTAERDPFERRLDSLARLLSGKSNCVAVSVINQKLYIAVNEFKSNTQDGNEILILIREVVAYFNKIAKGSSLAIGERAEIFKKICEQRLKLLGTSIVITKGVSDQVIEMILKNEDMSLLAFERRYGNNAREAGFMHAEFRKLYGDLLKLERSIRDKKGKVERLSSDEGEITDDQLAALSSDPVILKEEAPQKDLKEPGKNAKIQKPIHAEVQILSHLVGMLDIQQLPSKEIYIGISKLCCLHCRAMLEQTNEVFKEHQLEISLKTRGSHDLDFGDNWLPPKRFEKGYNASKPEENTSLADVIGFRTQVEIDTLMKERRNTGVQMVADHSSDDDATVDRKIEDKREYLEKQLGVLQQLHLQDDHITIEDTMEMMTIAIKLHKMPLFSDLCRNRGEATEETFFLLLQGFNEKKEIAVSPEFFLKILKNPLLVGDEMSRYFKRFELEIDLKEAPSHPLPSGSEYGGFLSFSMSEKDALEESRKIAERRGTIGPKYLEGWIIKNVPDDGNCFYLAVVDQLQLTQHKFLQSIPHGTQSNDSLRLQIQGEEFKDREWADHEEILKLSRKLGVIIAIVDTRSPNSFLYHYVDSNGESKYSDKLESLPQMQVIKLAYTGSHYLSVHGHPALSNCPAYVATTDSPNLLLRALAVIEELEDKKDIEEKSETNTHAEIHFAQTNNPPWHSDEESNTPREMQDDDDHSPTKPVTKKLRYDKKK